MGALVTWRSRRPPATMNDIVREYCAIAEEGAAFDDVRLAALREQMTEADLIQVKHCRYELRFNEIDALEAYGCERFGESFG